MMKKSVTRVERLVFVSGAHGSQIVGREDLFSSQDFWNGLRTLWGSSAEAT